MLAACGASTSRQLAASLEMAGDEQSEPDGLEIIYIRERLTFMTELVYPFNQLGRRETLWYEIMNS